MDTGRTSLPKCSDNLYSDGLRDSACRARFCVDGELRCVTSNITFGVVLRGNDRKHVESTSLIPPVAFVNNLFVVDLGRQRGRCVRPRLWWSSLPVNPGIRGKMASLPHVRAHLDPAQDGQAANRRPAEVVSNDRGHRDCGKPRQGGEPGEWPPWFR